MKNLMMIALLILFISGMCSQVWSQEAVSAQQVEQKLSLEREKGLEEQPTVKGGLNLEDALKLSLTYNRALQIVLEEKTIAKGRIWESYGEALPQVMFAGSYTRLDQVSSIEFEGMKINLNYLNNYSNALSIVQPIYRGGRAGAALRASKLYKLLVDENIRTLVMGTVFETVRSYYQVLLAQQQSMVTEEFVKLAEAHVKDVETKRKYGVASDFNVLRSEVELSNARALLIEYRNQLQIAILYLLKTMGVSQDSQIDLVDQLGYSPMQVNEEEALQQALANRPELEGAKLTVKLQQEAINSAKSNYWPGIDAFFNWNIARPDPHVSMFDKWGQAWNAGISFNFTIFDGLRREGQLIRERATLKQYQTRLLDSQEQIIFEINSALTGLQNAAESLEAQKLTLNQANEGLRLAEAGFKEGVLDQVSVLEARHALTQAKLLYNTSLFTHSMARLEVQRATGTLVRKQTMGISYPLPTDIYYKK